MFVEINLLPQKEQKNKHFIILLFILFLIGAAILAAAFFLARSYDGKIAKTDQEISQVRELAALQEQKLAEFEQSESVGILSNAVKWAETYPLKTVPLIKQLTVLLPERGFIRSLSYDETGSVSLTVQFDTNREAAYYLKNLLDAGWVTDASLQSLTTEELQEEAAEELAEGETTRAAEEEKPVPRYVGEYVLTIDKDILKREGQEEPAEEEGGEE